MNGEQKRDNSTRILSSEVIKDLFLCITHPIKRLFQSGRTFRDHEDYIKAKADNESFEVETDPNNFAWVINYAKEEYNRLEKRFDCLDKKADSIINYLGGGTALLTIGTIAGQLKGEGAFVLFLIPSFFCAVISVLFAVSAKNPTETACPPSVGGAALYSNHYHEKSEAMFAGQWHLACEGMAAVINEKAIKIKIATRWYGATILFLIIPILGVPFSTLR